MPSLFQDIQPEDDPRAFLRKMDLTIRKENPSQEAARKAHARKSALRIAMEEARQSPEDREPHRVIATWRITRWWMVIMGCQSPTGWLADLDPSLWQSPLTLRPPTDEAALRNPKALSLISSINDLTKKQIAPTLMPYDAPGLCLTPPPLPAKWQSNRDLHDYDPADDEYLQTFLYAVRLAIHSLGIEHGTEADPDIGIKGIQDILDPGRVRSTWPHPAKLLAWETAIVERTTNTLISKGVKRAIKSLEKSLNLTQDEISQVMALCKQQITEDYLDDKETQKAMSIARWQESIVRSRKALDLRAEQAALKQLDRVTGVDSVDPDSNKNMDFMDAIQVISTNRLKRIESREVIDEEE